MACVRNDFERSVRKPRRMLGLQRCAGPIVAVACKEQDRPRVGRRASTYEAQISLCRSVPGIA